MASSEPTGGDGSPIARYGASILHQTSRATFGSSGYSSTSQDAHGAPTEATSLRQTARSRAAQENRALQARVQSELMTNISSLSGPVMLMILGLSLLCVVAYAIAVLVLFVLALIATFTTLDKPCDEPLKWYMLTNVAWNYFSELVMSPLIKLVMYAFSLNDGALATLVTVSIRSLPSLGILAWGVYMVSVAKTCPATNPGLYYPLKSYIFAQLAFNILLLVFTIVCALGLRYILVVLNTLDEGPGCEAAVHKLPKVSPGSKILEEDGEKKNCVICLDELSAEENTVVQTPCAHLFHLECLADWCKKHLDCPLCRAPVGEEDPPKGSTERSPV